MRPVDGHYNDIHMHEISPCLLAHSLPAWDTRHDDPVWYPYTTKQCWTFVAKEEMSHGA